MFSDSFCLDPSVGFMNVFSGDLCMSFGEIHISPKKSAVLAFAPCHLGIWSRSTEDSRIPYFVGYSFAACSYRIFWQKKAVDLDWQESWSIWDTVFFPVLTKYIIHDLLIDTISVSLHYILVILPIWIAERLCHVLLMEIMLFGKFKTLLCYLTLGLYRIVYQDPNALELFA